MRAARSIGGLPAWPTIGGSRIWRGGRGRPGGGVCDVGACGDCCRGGFSRPRLPFCRPASRTPPAAVHAAFRGGGGVAVGRRRRYGRPGQGHPPPPRSGRQPLLSRTTPIIPPRVILRPSAQHAFTKFTLRWAATPAQGPAPLPIPAYRLVDARGQFVADATGASGEGVGEENILAGRGGRPRIDGLYCTMLRLRKMPIHCGSGEHYSHNISSTLATQMPQAVGVAYAVKLRHRLAAAKAARGNTDGGGGGSLDGNGGKSAPPAVGTTAVPTIAACFFGDGASSEGDAHAAFNFAPVLGTAPTLFLCRNNRYAISTPASEQYAVDGIAGWGPGYGIPAACIDGSDVLAVLPGVAAARAAVATACRPFPAELLANHQSVPSTADDASRYRRDGERDAYIERADPMTRLRALLHRRGWWMGASEEGAWRAAMRADVVAALAAAEALPQPGWDDLFEDVYDAGPPWLVRQRDELGAHIARAVAMAGGGVPRPEVAPCRTLVSPQCSSTVPLVLTLIYLFCFHWILTGRGQLILQERVAVTVRGFRARLIVDSAYRAGRCGPTRLYDWPRDLVRLSVTAHIAIINGILPPRAMRA
ncbi:hypothetical protein I4F81_002179 [Pyropia yezoensis]|uniref:Uncharacterized protein n=1 Tax=Pyropia yezoensis TaxID=2788 RepID=A0ACC3BPD1_PYRYE|nr:hypothetical protein I4F81_002179 [Neopyropia yezoensis]